jgi:hypothetical protein
MASSSQKSKNDLSANHLMKGLLFKAQSRTSTIVIFCHKLDDNRVAGTKITRQ